MDKAGMMKKLHKQCEELYIRKNADYGDSFSRSFKKWGLAMACIRLTDKMNRLESITLNGTSAVQNESLKDTLIDISNYALMTVIEMELGEKSKETDTAEECIMSDTAEAAPSQEEKSSQYTLEDVRNAVAACIKSGKKDEIKEALFAFNVKKLQELPEDCYDAMIGKCGELLA